MRVRRLCRYVQLPDGRFVDAHRYGILVPAASGKKIAVGGHPFFLTTHGDLIGWCPPGLTPEEERERLRRQVGYKREQEG